MITELLKGRRITGPVTNLAGAGTANAATIFTLSGSPLLGNKTVKLKKIIGRNNGVGSNTFLHVGTGVGAGFADGIPAVLIINNIDFEFGEEDLPQVEFGANITAYPEAVGGGSVDIQVEVEEIG